MEKTPGYSFSQTGYLPMLIFSAAGFIVLYFIYLVGFNFLFLLLFLLFVAAAVAFSRLEVKLTETKLEIILGRIIHRELKLIEVASVEVNPDKLYSIWGAWPIAGGWVYSVEGFSSASIYLKNGSKLILGCNDPQTLVEKIKIVNKNKFFIKN